MLAVFAHACCGLSLTSKSDQADKLPFLDLQLVLQMSRVSWCSSRAVMGLLPFDSAQSKFVK